MIENTDEVLVPAPEVVTSVTSDAIVAVALTTSRHPQIAIIIGACVVGVVIVAVAYFAAEYKKTKEPDLTQAEEDAVWRPDKEFTFTAPDSGAQATSTDGSTFTIGSDMKGLSFDDVLNRTKVEPYAVAAQWLPRPVSVNLQNLPLVFEDYYSRGFEVGTVTNGAFSGATIYLIYESGMGEYASLFAVGQMGAARVTDWTADVTDLPLVLSDTKTGLSLTRGTHQLGAALIDIEDRIRDGDGEVSWFVPSEALSLPDERLYRYQQCFFARTPSDLLVEYKVNVPFIDDATETAYGTPLITFTRTDGTRMSGTYEIYDRVGYGCGSLCSPLKVVDRTDDDFVKTGVTDSGHELYVLKNNNDELLQSLYSEPNTRAFVSTDDGSYNALATNKYSYDAFLSLAPLLFWKDPLDRWVKFVHSEFLILAEKCKPVIYLYPEKETALHVEVAPNVSFTKTIPAYENGWDVIAYPDGTIFDTKTKDTFHYLYWAGWVEGYPLIEKGWVVPQNDLDAFFDVYLARYGLIGKEIEDFKEYWEEDLDDAPYYAVSFVDQKVIDQLSPLSIDVAPDTIIRVLMTAMPLKHPIELDAPYIPPTPVRHGFTVAEWGGTVLRAE